ncbi:MAG: acetyltransferase [Acidobacteriota bacterium]|jgi:sugar O-acyltransferase (sialic acid O-acetyltransferase NeuD family)|nr:acetyltransferase [Acidobacteriota bacterium]
MATQDDAGTRPLLILGTHILAPEVADVVSDIPGVRIAGFVENMDRDRCRNSINGLPVFWIDDLAGAADKYAAICGIATTHRSRFTDQIDSLGLPFATLVHPTAHVSRTASLGPGTLVGAGAIIGAHTSLGRHVFVNRGVLIGHHTHIGDFVSLQPGANVAGACTVEPSAYIGMGAIVIDHKRVGRHSVVAAGAVVIEDLPDHVLAVGVPAKIVKRDIQGK